MAASRLCSLGIDSSSLAYSSPLSFSDTLFFSSRVSNPNEEACFTGSKRLRLPCLCNTTASPATKDRGAGSGQDGRRSQTGKDGRRSPAGRNGRGQGRVRDEQRTRSRRDSLPRDSKKPLILLPEPIGRREAICKPSIDDHLLTQKFLRGPLLRLKSLPVLSSCLPNAPFNAEDHEWIDENLGRVKEVLGVTPATNGAEKLGENSPRFHLDSLLYLAFQHDESSRSMRSQHVKTAHSRLWFLGEHVLELALAEYLLMRYPREMPACIRERVLGLINKRALPHWFRKVSLDRVMFPDYGMDSERSNERLQVIRGVFWALIGAVYLSMGMGEIYRILFEVFGFDPDAEGCQPKERMGREDIDRVYPLFDEKPMSWRDLATKSEDDALFAKPLLYWACVPLGMERFRGNLWEIDSLPHVLQILGYPLPSPGEDASVTIARNAALELGLQLCFLHPSKYKTDHPRFCNERLEYLGSKIQDVVMAEKLLMRNLIARGLWLKERHRQSTYNSAIGRYFREKKLQDFMIIADSRVELFQKAKRVRNFATTGVAMALHGLGYAVYGKSEVRRLMFDLFDIERLQAHID